MTDGTPGWFRDPSDATLARWHDGERWTEHTLVIADQTPGVEPAPPVIEPGTAVGGLSAGLAAAAARDAEEEPFRIPRSGLGGGAGGLPTWAKIGAPIAVVVLALAAFLITQSGNDDNGGTATVDTVPASLDVAVKAARRAGLPEEVSDARAAALIERICGATTRAAAVDQLGEDLAQLPATDVNSLRQSIGALGVGAALRCRSDMEAAPHLIDDLKDIATQAFSTSTTAPTVVPGGEVGTDGGTATTSGGRSTATTKKGSATTAKPATTTTTAKPLPQVLPNTSCSPEGAKGQHKITGAGLTCMKCPPSTKLTWHQGPCPTTVTPPTTDPNAPTTSFTLPPTSTTANNIPN